MRASAGKGTKGERLYDWACVELPESGMYREGVLAGRWLLMRRGIAEPEKIAYYLYYGPAQTPVPELIGIAGRRWVIEDCFEATDVDSLENRLVGPVNGSDMLRICRKFDMTTRPTTARRSRRSNPVRRLYGA